MYTKEEKIQIFRELVDEWVTYLDLYKDVSVREFTKEKLLVSNTIKKRDAYGEFEVQDVKLVDIEPTSYIEVKYHTPTKDWMDPRGHESREFPYSDIDKRITHYKYKLAKEKKKSSKNIWRETFNSLFLQHN